ncbi:hypothetical protein B0I35DRAFT_362055 [Stachybotrys elegans]|uniref:Uncharacterized protein n=1 Tax=Stachybotrys elegans TaxID=80388 RepID=A0A8K0WLK2_9HYPO|nr:hypothetical protein B0I35DRAFT_362055 [Stachybotrys elegans]
MVIGLLAITAIPTTIGVGQAISAQKKQNASVSKEQEKFYLVAMFNEAEDDDDYDDFQDAATCVLIDGKLYLNLPEHPVVGHKFCGWYFKYPSEEGHLGLVSMVSNDPPLLNWIYVDKDSHAVTYGGRKDTLGHVIGPWGWSDDERLLSLEGEDALFVAVKEEHQKDDGTVTARWAVYWDPEGEIEEREGEDRCQEVRLRRQMQLGMESRYVRDK